MIDYNDYGGIPRFYFAMPVGVLHSVHNMCEWMGYTQMREEQDMLTASMVCDFYNNNK